MNPSSMGLAPPPNLRWTDERMRELFTDRVAARAVNAPGGATSLTTGSSRPDMDRPQLPLLVRLLQDGFRALDEVPLGELTAAVAAGSVPWEPRFPFVGPTPGTWETVDRWPSSATSPWRQPSGVPISTPPLTWVVSRGSTMRWVNIPADRFELVAGVSGACWVRLPPNLFVLVREMRTPWVSVGPPLPTIGFAPADASLVGLAWMAMREAIDRFNRWFDALRASRWSGVYGLPAFSIVDGTADVLARLRQLTSGDSGERVHLYESEALQDGALSSQARYAAINVGCSSRLVLRSGAIPRSSLGWLDRRRR